VLPNQEGFAIQNKIFGFNFQFKKKVSRVSKKQEKTWILVLLS